jgi:hypothetical protein
MLHRLQAETGVDPIVDEELDTMYAQFPKWLVAYRSRKSICYQRKTVI